MSERKKQSWKQSVHTKWDKGQEELGEPFWPDSAARAWLGGGGELNHHLLNTYSELENSTQI